jgi:hypothetical protein
MIANLGLHDPTTFPDFDIAARRHIGQSAARMKQGVSGERQGVGQPSTGISDLVRMSM